MEVLCDEITLLMTAHEQNICRMMNLHKLVDSSVQDSVDQLETARRCAHEEIEKHMHLERETVNAYIKLLEIQIESIQLQSDCSNVCVSVEVTDAKQRAHDIVHAQLVLNQPLCMKSFELITLKTSNERVCEMFKMALQGSKLEFDQLIEQAEMHKNLLSATFVAIVCTKDSKFSDLKKARSYARRAVSWLEVKITRPESDEFMYACYGLGEFHLSGIGGEETNYVKGFPLIHKSAQLGFVMAQHAIGLCYESGTGVVKNMLEAVLNYKCAASQGYPMSQYKLGTLYSVGRFVAKDEEASYGYLKQAADNGHPEAQQLVGDIYNTGTGAVVDVNPQEAMRYYLLAAHSGLASAQCSVGSCYEKGLGANSSITSTTSSISNSGGGGVVVVDGMAEAVRWYALAAAQGDVNAMCRLGQCYEKLCTSASAAALGKGVHNSSGGGGGGGSVDQWMLQAARWYKEAAKQGHAESQYHLGCCYSRGVGVERNMPESVRLHKLAARQGFIHLG